MNQQDLVGVPFTFLLPKLSRQGIWVVVLGPGTVGNLRVKMGKKQRPSGLAIIESLCGSSEVLHILIVGQDQERILNPIKPLLVFFQS